MSYFLQFFKFDRVSFWLGFLAASLFWWVFSKLKAEFPVLKAYIQKKKDEARERNLAGFGYYIRQETLRRVQKLHFTASISSLDEIIIPPTLMGVPPAADPNTSTIDSITNQVIPYLPEWPELSSEYCYPRVPISAALQDGVGLVIMGLPGAGKTTALSYLASQVAKQAPEIGILKDYLPIFVHIQDLNIEIEENGDAIQTLINYVTTHMSMLVQPRLKNFLVQSMYNGKILLMADGLDELPFEENRKSVRFLESVLKKNKNILLVTTASSYFVGELPRLGLNLMSLTAWNQAEREQFFDNFGKVWASIAQEANRQSKLTPMDPSLIQGWFSTEHYCFTPFEWTLITWAAFAGDLNGISVVHALEAYMHRTTSGIPRSGMVALANLFCQKHKSSLTYAEIESFISGLAKTDTQIMIADEPTPETPGQTSAEAKKARPVEAKISSGDRLISVFQSKGILVSHTSGKLSFNSPVVLGYLASQAADPQYVLYDHANWAPRIQNLRFRAAQNQVNEWMDYILNLQDAPLYRGYQMVSRWIADTPIKAEWRVRFMRQMLSFLHKDNLPYSIRACFLAAFVTANDPSVSSLFKQLLKSESPTIRQIGILGSGAIQDAKAVQELSGLFNDSIPDIRLTASLAVGAIHSSQAKQALANALLHGDEGMRQAATETFASHPGEGYDVLREAVEENDLLVRRAAVLGLAQIREKWVQEIIEKITIEDGQWVVRNAAGQILEAFQHSTPYVPAPLKPPAETAWLLTYASKLGKPVPVGPSSAALDILISAFQNGTLEERLAALRYLRDNPQETVIFAVNESLINNTGPLCEAAINTIWYFSVTGKELDEVS
jgi:HEAT repeat protein